MTKYQRIQKLCKEKGCSVAQMERELGFARGSVAKIDAHKPSIDRVSKICLYLGVSPMTLLVGDDSDLDEYTEAKAYTDAINLTVSEEVPVHDVSAGQGRINEDYETVRVPSDDDSSYVRICGDSMYPILHDGDVVRVVPATETVPSDYTIVKINGNESTCKHIEKTSDGIWLRAENSEVFEDKFYSMQECLTLPVQIVGKAVEIVSRKL